MSDLRLRDPSNKADRSDYRLGHDAGLRSGSAPAGLNRISVFHRIPLGGANPARETRAFTSSDPTVPGWPRRGRHTA